MFLAGHHLHVDPYIRLSIWLIWESIETEKLNGVQPSNSAILFRPTEGYYIADPDLISLNSLNINAAAPSAPGPSNRLGAPTFPRPAIPAPTTRPGRMGRVVKSIIDGKNWQELFR